MQHPSQYHRSSLRAELNRISRFLRLLSATMLVAVLFCFSATSSHAQLIPGSQWAVFRQADGLLASDLYTVLPTAGVVWFGGRDGVSRFDGTWTTYPLTPPAAKAAAAETLLS